MVSPTYIISSTIDRIFENISFPTILTIVGEPNYETIAEVHFKLNANSASIQSNFGDGHLGLLFLTVSPAVYNTLSTTAFVPPVNPSATAIITAGATAAATANERWSFTDATALFKKYDSVDKFLNKMLLVAVEKKIVRSLQTKYLGYLNLFTHDILEHLYSEYPHILASDLQNNDVAIKTA